jgi:hypothetical protein
MSCVLRISGGSFDVESFLRDSSLVPLIVLHRGHSRFADSRQPPEDHSGMNVSVSTRDFSDLAGQIADAIAFLSAHTPELSRLRNYPGVEKMQLDFPVEDRDTLVQTDVFPATLLTLMGKLNIELAVSHYPPEP